MLSGSFCISGSGHYIADAVREESYAGRLAGEAKTFRHPPSPLQEEVNRVIVACVYVMVPLAAILLFTLKVRNISIEEAAQTATAGLVTLIPEGMVLLMSVTFAVAAVRLARKNTLIQQMSATESLAAVDTICVDKTGTLTDGELRLVSVAPARGSVGVEGPRRAGALRRQRRRAQPRPWRRSPERFPASARWRSAPRCPSPRSGSGAGCRDRRDQLTCWGPPTCSARPGRSSLPPILAQTLEEETAAGRRVVAFGESRRAAAGRPLAASTTTAHARWRWSCLRRRCAPTPPRRSPSCGRRRST